MKNRRIKPLVLIAALAILLSSCGRHRELQLAMFDGEDKVLMAADSFSWPLGQGETLETEIRLDGALSAPVLAGTKVGAAVFLVNGREAGQVDLLCGETVTPKAASALSVWKPREKGRPAG